MTKKLLVARVGVGTLTIAFCATLPGCNLPTRIYQPQCDGAAEWMCLDASPFDRPVDRPGDSDAPPADGQSDQSDGDGP
jgi:hypothetical protein